MEIVDTETEMTSEMELSRHKLRQRWELASVLNFLTVFEPVLEFKVKFSAEEIEAALIEPNNNLAQLHIMLLKGIPPVSKLLKDSNGWVIALSKKLEMWWPWVAEGNFPLTAKKGEEISTYKALDPTTRLLILKALCEIRADQFDTISYINDETKNRTDSSAFRKEKLGGNGNEVSFWYDGNETIGHRLYKEVYQVESMSKVKDKKRISAVASQWETLATTFEEFQNFVFSSSQVKWEADVGKAVEAHAIPALQKIQRKKDMALKRQQREQQREQRFVEGLKNLAAPRSCRIRRPVNYRSDDFDRAIKEAIEATNKRKANEDPTNETRPNEHGPMNETNSLDSSPASNSISSDTTDSGTESDRLQGSNDDVDDTADEVNEADPDEDGADSMEENSRLDHRPSNCRQSKRIAGVTGYAVPESPYIGAKNRLRQRPIVNTAAESVVIPDSEDEN
ncbi:DDT domain-containing protein DDR4 isoform X2 [Lycium ferocissimum]|uniref:DDT domain-containing protein DDR4 isoform X2 n=1 Tax=Lycium ferocissimum TaxID=112874 RepID=UPI0028158138|nr:DDT domain-containing protein DDR4 isoform X2 [Lycium ferocissimum]